MSDPDNSAELHKHLSQPKLLGNLRVGKMACVAATLEAPAAVASVLTGDPTYIEAVSYFTVVVAGVTLYDAHNHIKNHYPVASQVTKLFLKDGQ